MRAYPRNEEIRSSGWSGTESPYECNCDFPDVAHVLGCPLRQLSVGSDTKGGEE